MNTLYTGLRCPRSRCPSASILPTSRGRRLRALTGDSRSVRAENLSDSNIVNSDLQLRLKRKTRGEVITAGARVGLQTAYLEEQLDVFESLLPNVAMNLEQMRASDWARVVADSELGAKLVLIKVAFPALNVEALLSKHPRTLLWSRTKLEDNIGQHDRAGGITGAPATGGPRRRQQGHAGSSP